MTEHISKIILELKEAESSKTPVLPLTSRYGLSVEGAYEVQRAWGQEELAKGRKLSGYKVGLTSKAAQKHFGVFEPDFGHLFEDMLVQESVSLSELIQPKVEGEIAFELCKDLGGTSVTFEQAVEAIGGAAAAIEIIDSRIENWKIGAADTIADNGSSARFAIGPFKPFSAKELPTAGMAFSCNDEVLFSGAGAAVMDNPVHAVVFLVNALGRFGLQLKKGQVILSGALSGMVSLEKGKKYKCEVLNLGQVEVKCQ